MSSASSFNLVTQIAGNKQRAAEALQISFKALTSKLREYGLAES